jgi:hypothetical protein
MNDEKIHEEIDAFKEKMAEMITMIRDIPIDIHNSSCYDLMRKIGESETPNDEQLKVFKYVKFCKSYIYYSTLRRIKDDVIYMRYLEDEIDKLSPDDPHMKDLKKQNRDIWNKLNIKF